MSTIPFVWHVNVGVHLTQVEVDVLMKGGFCLAPKYKIPSMHALGANISWLDHMQHRVIGDHFIKHN